jgi:thioredoxin-related protein
MKLLLACLISFNALAETQGVDWFKGTVSEAFSLGKKQNKPLFLYWGAVWCPPCNQIKKKVFSSKEFQDKVKSFIPVYLDGDEKRAQVWGEKLKAKGYPTMIVFSPAGKEVMRMPIGISAKEYAKVLDDVATQLTPISQLLKLALEKPKKVTADQWRILANYSWGQDPKSTIPWQRENTFFKKLMQNCPHQIEKAKFFVRYILASKEERFVKSKSYQQKFSELIESDKLFFANAEDFQWNAKEMLERFYSNPASAKKVAALIQKQAYKFADKKELEAADQIAFLVTVKSVEDFMNGGKYSSKLKTAIEKKVNYIDQTYKDHYSRQSSIMTGTWLLKKTGQKQQALKLYAQEIKNSKTPYYAMSGLAAYYQELGEKVKALDWSRKAWQSIDQSSSRFQWGVSYLQTLVELEPKNTDKIASEVSTVISEVLDQTDAFAGRNKLRFERLKGSLGKWSEYPKIKKAVNKVCETSKQHKKSCLQWSQSI